MTRILVLGSTGLLGQAVYRALSASPDLQVDGGARDAKAGIAVDAQAGAEAIHRVLADRPYAYVINCIGMTRRQRGEEVDADRALQINGIFPHQLAAAASASGSRLIHVSTDGVFIGRQAPYVEDAVPDADDWYGRSKALGEVRAPGALTIRCSFVGRDPQRHRGLLEWLLGQPDGAVVTGYIDHVWTGVTTVQFAVLCDGIIRTGRFDEISAESPIHHFCPNPPVSKYELLQLIRSVFQKDVTIVPAPAPHGPCSRVLRSRYHRLNGLCGTEPTLEKALAQLVPGG